MRQRSLFVRLVGVGLFSVLCSLNAFAQTAKITEGSLRVLGGDGGERGLCPLKQTDVKAQISGRLSRVTVTQTFQNPFAENIEAVYAFPLPNDAALDEMTIKIGERFIKRRNQALETDQKAIKEGKTAALTEAQRPNIFTQTIGNISPNAKIEVVISYVETVKYADGVYEFAFPMTVGERYIPLPQSQNASPSGETGIADADKSLPARTVSPINRFSLEVKLDAGVSIEDLASGTHEIESLRFSASSFLVRLKNEGDLPNRDFVLKYKRANRVTEAASSGGNAINTSDSRAETNVSTESRDNIGFLRGSGFQGLLSTATGITQTGENPLIENRGLVSSSGQRPTSNRFSVDGLSANLGVSADETSLSRNAGQLPALTAAGGTNNFTTSAQTQEITVKTLGNAREQRVPGAEINIISTGGSNSFRGSLFETFGNEKLNANDFFANSRGLPRPASRLNQFGGTLGGFIWKDKAWFFGGYEGLRLRQAGFNVSEVPNLFSRQSISTGAYRQLFRAYPVPPGGLETSNGFSEFAATYTNPATHDIFGLRIDAQPSGRLRIGGRYNFADSTASIRGDRDFSLSTVRKLDTETGSLSAWATYTPTPFIVVNGRLNFSRNGIGQQFTTDDFGGAAPFALSSAFDFLKYDFAGRNTALAVGSPLRSNIDQFETNGALDWTRGKHQFTFGTDFRRLRLDIGAATTERNVLFKRLSPTFGSDTTAAARVTELTRALTENPAFDNFSLYAQHNWRITSRLNLNLGLRWDADFAPRTSAPDVTFGNASLKMPRRLSNFAPRAGFAFDITSNGRGVVRGGTGLYFDYANGAASETFANSFPFAAGRFARNVFFDATPTEPLRPLAVFDNRLKTPRTWHTFVEFQQEVFRNHIFTAGYTYSAGRNLFLTRTLLEADPDFKYVRLTSSDGGSDFSALELRFERRFSQGFSFNARYALSKSKDNFSPDTFRETRFPATDLEQERGSSDFEVRHQFNLFGVYDIPTFFESGWAKRLTEDWSLSAFVNARTGYPLSVGFWRVNDFGKEFIRADRVAGVPAFLDEDTIKRLNPNAFALPPAGAPQGNLKRNSLRGFPLFQLDASLQRRIRFTNEMRLDLGISAFNVLNNTNFADMSGNLGTRYPNGSLLENEYFGRATTVFGSSNFTPFYLYGGARTIQFSAKFVF